VTAPSSYYDPQEMMVKALARPGVQFPRLATPADINELRKLQISANSQLKQLTHDFRAGSQPVHAACTFLVRVIANRYFKQVARFDQPVSIDKIENNGKPAIKLLVGKNLGQYCAGMRASCSPPRVCIAKNEPSACLTKWDVKRTSRKAVRARPDGRIFMKLLRSSLPQLNKL